MGDGIRWMSRSRAKERARLWGIPGESRGGEPARERQA